MGGGGIFEIHPSAKNLEIPLKILGKFFLKREKLRKLGKFNWI